MTAAAICTLATLVLLPTTVAHADHGRPQHWNRNYPTVTAVAQVYFEDFTGPAWPIYSTVYKWDNRPAYLRPYYREANKCSHRNLHCVPIRTGNYGQTPWDGQTSFSYNKSTNHIVHDSMTIRFNTYYTWTSAQREAVVCHEMGHGLGVEGDRRGDTDSCMHETQYNPDPKPHDFDPIEYYYNH